MWVLAVQTVLETFQHLVKVAQLCDDVVDDELWMERIVQRAIKVDDSYGQKGGESGGRRLGIGL